MKSSHRSKPLARRKPLARKSGIVRRQNRRATKRIGCEIRGCRGRVWCLGLCRKHAVREADTAFSALIRKRDGRCVGPGHVEFRKPTRQHSGGLQCSHHITRSRYRTRWDPMNAVAHCAGCHMMLTENPALHHEWILGYLGFGDWDALMDKAYGPRDEDGRRATPSPWTAADMEEVLVRLRYGMESEDAA